MAYARDPVTRHASRVMFHRRLQFVQSTLIVIPYQPSQREFKSDSAAQAAQLQANAMCSTYCTGANEIAQYPPRLFTLSQGAICVHSIRW